MPVLKKRSVGSDQEGATFTGEYRDSKTNGNGNPEPEAPRVVSKVFDNTFFGYRKVTVDRPPRPGTEGKPKKGEKPYDKDLRDTGPYRLPNPSTTTWRARCCPMCRTPG